MLEPINGRTMFYGKSDVLTYRTYAKPLAVTPFPNLPSRAATTLYSHIILHSRSRAKRFFLLFQRG